MARGLLLRRNVTRILVVDDSALIRKVLERLLAEQGLETVSFARTDGAADIDVASVGAAILDVEIEDQSGIELGRSLLARDPSLPVSFLTGTTDPSLIREARALGPVFEKGDDLTPAATWAGTTARRSDPT
jgi:FixJ family two-component response regulator